MNIRPKVFFALCAVILFSGVACGAPRVDRTVALTFDDGPHGERTLELLRVLSDENVKASFFVVGKQAAFNRQVLRRIRDGGHTVANHSNSHPNLTELPPDEACGEYLACSAIIRDTLGTEVRFCRPPGGRTNASVEEAGRRAELMTVYWTVNSRDYTGLSPERIVRRVLGSVRPGGIVLMHDGVDATIRAIPEIVRELRKRGYRFVTLDELFPVPLGARPGSHRRGGIGS